MNAGAVLIARGHHEQATGYWEEALLSRERAMGPDHPQVAEVLSALAGALEERGEHTMAMAHHKRALRIVEKSYGPDHVEVVTEKQPITQILAHLGRPTEPPLVAPARAPAANRDV